MMSCFYGMKHLASLQLGGHQRILDIVCFLIVVFDAFELLLLRRCLYAASTYKPVHLAILIF